MSLGKTLVCVIKTSPLSSTIKTLEPIDQNIRGRSKPTFKKLLQGGNDTLRVFKVRFSFIGGSKDKSYQSVCMTDISNVVVGVLYSGAVYFDSFPQDEVVRWVHEWLRDCGSGDAGCARIIGSRRHVSRVRAKAG